MAFRTVAQSFPNDPNPPPPLPPVPMVGPLAPIALGHVHPHVALHVPPPLPRLRRISLERVAQANGVEPGYGLSRITLAPLDPATGAAPGAMVFGASTTSFRPTDLPGGGFTEQFLWCPGEGASVELRFEIIRANRVQTCLLELYARGGGAPIWTQDFGNLAGLVPAVVPVPLPHRSYYRLPFDCRIGNPGGTVGVVSAPDPRFPGGWLVNEHGPYKLRMVITAAAGVAVEAEAWTYFHVPTHKFRLIRYVPSTEVGCIGLEFAPGQQDLKVITNAFFGFGPDQLVPAIVPMGAGVKNQHAADTRGRLYRDWSARYSLHIGNADLRPLVYVQPQAGALADVNDPQQGDVYAGYITGLARAANRDFPVVFAKGNVGSGIVPSAAGHHLDLFLPRVLEERTVSVMIQGETYWRDVALVREAMRTALRTAPPSVSSITTAPVSPLESAQYTIVMSLGRGAVDLDPAAANWLQNTFVPAMNGLIPRLSHPIPVLLKAKGKQGRAQNSRRTRQALARVRQVLVNGLTAPPGGAGPGATADQMSRANAGFRLQPDVFAPGNEPRRVVHIDVDLRPGDPAHNAFPDHPYTALVHEFGHVFGLPDEYMDYSNPTNRCYVIYRSQPRLSALAAQYGVEAPVFPTADARIQDSNLMTCGTVFHERYYLTFIEALAKLTCIGAGNAITYGAPPNRGAIPGIPAVNAVEDPAFAPIVTVLRNATDTFERGHLRGPPVAPPRLTPAQLQADILTEAQAAGHAAVLYAQVLDSDAVDPALATGRAGMRYYARSALLVGDECLHGAIQAEPLRSRIALELEANVARGYAKDTAFFPAAGTPRVKLTLSVSRTFAGTGQLTVAPGGVVQLYDAAAAGNIVPVPAVFQGTANPGELAHAAGVELWAEGLAEGTVLATLTLSTGGMGPVVVSSADPVNLHVKAPAVLFVEDQPAGPGVFLPLAGGLNSHFPRKRVLVRRTVANLGGTQIRVDKPAAGGPAGDYTLYDHGGALVGFPHDLNNAAFGPNGEVELFLEGTTGSPAVGDRALTLGIVGGAVFATTPITVVTLHDLEITIPSTPPLTARNFGLHGIPPRTSAAVPQNPNAPGPRVFKPHVATHGYTEHGAPAPGGAPAAADYGSDDFAVNHPLVLIEGSLAGGQSVSVKGVIEPSAVPATWIVERDEDDDERLERLTVNPLPTVANAANVVGANLEQTGQLTLNAVGGFHLRLSVNGRDVLLTVNAILVRARALAASDQSRANVPRGVAVIEPHITGVPAIGQNIQLNIGTFAGANINQPGERLFGGLLRGRVHLIGAGDKGRVGQTQVFTGWIQNFIINRAVGHYVDSAPPGLARDVILTAATNVNEATMVGGDPYFNNPLHPRVALGAPLGNTDRLLDTGRLGLGGPTSLLGQSAADPPANDDDLGWVQKASAGDSPNTQFYLRHLGQDTALLTEMTYEQVFRSYLCVWTDSTTPALNGQQDTRGAATRLFATVGDLEWGFSGQWTVTIQNGVWAGAGNGNVAIPENRVRVRPVQGMELVVQITHPFTAYPAARPAEGNVEVCRPTILHAFAWESMW